MLKVGDKMIHIPDGILCVVKNVDLKCDRVFIYYEKHDFEFTIEQDSRGHSYKTWFRNITEERRLKLKKICLSQEILSK